MDDTQSPTEDKRHISRLLAVQYLYTKFSAQKDELSYTSFEPDTLLQMLETKKFNRKLYTDIVEGVSKNVLELDKIITEQAPQWPLDQINLVNLIILRIAIWEAFFSKITPVKVAINEAIDLDKELSDISSSKFINGVLGKIAENFTIDNTTNETRAD
jgi:transcription antitermination protein NusB